MNLNAITTVTSGAPTAASGVVTFEVADPASIPVVPCLALHYPQLRNDSSGVTRAKQSQAIEIASLVGNLVTAQVGFLDTTGRSIGFSDVIDCAYFANFNQGQATADLRSSGADNQTMTGYAAVTGRRSNTWDGSTAAPLTGTIIQPTNYISRTVQLVNQGDYDWGALEVNVKSLAPGLSQAQAVTVLLEQFAAYDANALGVQIRHWGAAGGLYGLYTNLEVNSHVCTISHASPGVVTLANHGLTANREIEFSSEAAITGASAANPTHITTATAHGHSSGERVAISGVPEANGDPTVNGRWTVTVIDGTHFTIPVNVGSARGSGGVVSTKAQLPAGLTENTRYFVKTVVDANRFTVAATPGGTVIATTSDGTGTFYVNGNQISGVNVLNINGAHQDFTYNGSGSRFLSGIDLQVIGSKGYLAGMGIWFTNNNDGKWSEGIVTDAGTIENQVFLLYDSALTLLEDHGARTVGIDLSHGTYSELGIKLATAFGLQAAGFLRELTFETGYGFVHGVNTHETDIYGNGGIRAHFDGSWTPTAHETFFHLYEGATPTARQVQWKDGGSIGLGDKVMVLV